MPGRWEMYPRNTQNTRKQSARIRGTNCRKSTEENEGNKEGSPTSFSDTVSRVIQPRARRAPGSSPQPSVNNSAEPEMKSSENFCVRGILATAASPWAGHGRSFPILRGFNGVYRPARRRPSQRLREQRPTRLLVSGRRMTAPRCISAKQNL